MKNQTLNRFKYASSCAFLIVLLFTMLGCEKYLDVKPNKKIATPSLLSDLDGMLNYYNSINGKYPSAGEVSADNYTLSDANWASSSELHRNYYTWQKYDATAADYSGPYVNILTANIILETLPQLNFKPTEQAKANDIKGAALFIRAYYHYALAQLFAPVYKESTAHQDNGIVLKLNSSLEEPTRRATVQENYISIIADLKSALPLLNEQPIAKYRPSKAAAFGALARTYLVMQRYAEAGLYADSCLQLYNRLMDYNKLQPNVNIPFQAFNEEVVYDNRTAAPSALSQARARVDEELYRTYEADDLRKSLFFKTNADGSNAFKGNYTGLNTAVMFTGIATDEMYLIKAESLARAGQSAKAVTALRTLLLTRYKTNKLSDYSAMNADEILNLILLERRKQLLFRTTRWSDLRRLNQETRFAKTLKRTVNNQEYTLVPGSPRYTLQIDLNAILLGGIAQNP